MTSRPTGCAAAGPPGRPPAFDRTDYPRRTVVERCVNPSHAVPRDRDRFDKTAISYQGVIDLATLFITL
nr:transposase [Streptoalloteichus tenebrarius]BFF04023.1 hypothetical protein GCM10020241_56980 [Streptoalloteichus tenebrarius]